MVKIKILKDTPFDRAGATLDIKEFRLKYNYICSKETTDEELIAYLQNAHLPGGPVGKMAEFFAVDGLCLGVPNDFLYNGLLYSKQLDGMYHKFLPGAIISPDSTIELATVAAATDKFFNTTKYRKLVWYCTDNARRKL